MAGNWMARRSSSSRWAAVSDSSRRDPVSVSSQSEYTVIVVITGILRGRAPPRRAAVRDQPACAVVSQQEIVRHLADRRATPVGVSANREQ